MKNIFFSENGRGCIIGGFFVLNLFFYDYGYRVYLFEN